MRIILIFPLLLAMACSNKNKSKEIPASVKVNENLIAVLDTIWQTEQTPIRLRIL